MQLRQENSKLEMKCRDYTKFYEESLKVIQNENEVYIQTIKVKEMQLIEAQIQVKKLTEMIGSSKDDVDFKALERALNN